MSHNFIFSLSVGFAIIGILSMLSSESIRTIRIIGSMLFFLSSIMGLVYWIANYMTGQGLTDAVFFTIMHGLSHAGWGDFRGMILIGILWILLTIIIISFLFKKKVMLRFIGVENNKWIPLIGLTFLLLSIVANPTLQFSLKFIHNNQDLSFWRFYREPTIVNAHLKKKKLVYIYCESLERTYFNETKFPHLMKKLKALENEGCSFTNIGQVPGTGWTMGGMCASQLGIPLMTPFNSKTTMNRNSMSGIDLFLPGATGMPELLKSQGFYLVYVGGADLDFGGKRNFLTTHNFDRMYGKEELAVRLRDKKYMSAWGIYDDSMLDFAYSEFKKLCEKENKFALFLLTLDTHCPVGHLSKECKSKGIYYDGKGGILDAVACSDYLISQFIHRIQSSPWNDQTLIVVASDHLSMRNDAFKTLNHLERRNLFFILGSEKNPGTKISKPGTTLDIGPTVLHSMGLTSRLGLGRNLLSHEKTLAEMFGNKFSIKLVKWRHEIYCFWNFPTLKDGLFFNYSPKEVKLGTRTVKFPVLITYNRNLQTQISFQFDLSPGEIYLIDRVHSLDPNQAFIWIDKSCVLRSLCPRLPSAGYGLVIGKLGSKHWTAMPLHEGLEVKPGLLEQVQNDKISQQIARIHREQLKGWKKENVILLEGYEKQREKAFSNMIRWKLQ